MSKISRRKFLISVAAGMGTIAFDQWITACSPKNGTPVETQAVPSPAKATALPTQTRPPAATSASSPTQSAETAASQPTDPAAAQAPASTPTQAGVPDLVVARRGEPEEMVRRALAALGGMNQFVKPGANVMIKPNICVAYHTYEYAATTNPWVVAALVKLCLEAGAASVGVLDYPFGGTAAEAYVKSGIEEQVKAAGGEMIQMVGFKYVSVDIPNGKSLLKTDIYGDLLKADVLINVPIAKHHNLARLTLSMKNLMGVIRNRSALHQDLGQRLPDLAMRISPALTVIDAVRILKNHGPTGGNLNDVEKLDTVIVSKDFVAADAYAATLFGLQPDELNYVRAAAERGLGRSDLKSLRIEELNVGA